MNELERLIAEARAKAYAAGQGISDWWKGTPAGMLSQGNYQGAAQRINQGLTEQMKGDPIQAGLDWASPMGGMLGGVVGHTAWHGSPHIFDKFDLAKMGTGEGAQAFGHGAYLAEAPGVAKGYRKTTSYQDQVRQFQKELPDDASFDEILDMANSGQLSPQSARVIKELEKDDWLGFDYPSQAITAAFRQGKNYDMSPGLKSAIEEYGNLYKVDIPDESIAKMLDWDKPFSQQPQEVQSAIKKLYPPSSFLDKDPTGKNIYMYVEDIYGTGADASKKLNELGVPGIKYFDQASRASGEGTRNFVMFNPDDIRILERNSVPTGNVPWNKK